MRLRMLWYQFRMLTIRDGVKRTAYLKKRNVYAGIGENVMIQSRKIPLYPELIRIGNNVRMASNVLFVSHDVVHNMLNRISPKTEKILVGGVFHEKVGCIEIGNNVLFLDKRIQETYLQYVDVSPTYYCMVDANAEWEKFYLKRGNLDD